MILEATHTFKIQDSNMFCKQCCPPAVQFKRCYEDNKVDKFYVYNAVPQFSFLSVAAGIFLFYVLSDCFSFPPSHHFLPCSTTL